jgi:hypothetical protein
MLLGDGCRKETAVPASRENLAQIVRRGFPANLGIVTAIKGKVAVAVKRCYLNFLLICFF